MKWPPNKAWTSCCLREGFRHFVAINYGGKGDDRWVNLVSVLDGDSRLHIPWREMKDSTKWKTGWLQLRREEADPIRYKELEDKSEKYLIEDICLHPSKDSGFLIPSPYDHIRPWGED